jgi:predicted peptidase
MLRQVSPLLIAFLVGCGSSRPVTAVPATAEINQRPPGIHQEVADLKSAGPVLYTISVPVGYDGKTPVPLVLVLHFGYDGTTPAPYTGKEMMDAFKGGLSSLNAIIIAPDALGSDWTSKTNEKAAVSLTQSVMKTYAIDRARVIVTGYSMGGKGVWFIGSRNQDLFTGAIPVAAPIAGENIEWKIPVYVIHSTKDEIVSYTAAKKHADAIMETGATIEFRSVSELTHYDTRSYARYVGDAVTWLQAAWK